MNILYLCPRVPFPPKDGGTIGVWSLIENLAKIGNKITILSLNTNKHYINLDSIIHNLPKNIELIGVDINTDIKLSLAAKNLFFSKLPYNFERFYSKSYEFQLEKILHSRKFDIVQLDTPMAFFYIDAIRRNSNIPIVARTANIENEIWHRIAKQEKNILRKKYYKILAKRTEKIEVESINKSDAFIAVTDINTEYFKKKTKNIKCKTVQTGVNSADILTAPLKHAEVNFCFIGALDWYPNQEGILWFLQNIWNVFWAKTKKYKFYVAGRNTPKHIIETLENYENVVFCGEVPVAKEYIRQHSIMLVPLLSGSGMRVKIVEGMANGAAIISTKLGAEGINVTHNKNILLADAPGDFVENMLLLSKNAELRNNIAKSGLEFVKSEFDNILIAKKLNDFYSEILAEQKEK